MKHLLLLLACTLSFSAHSGETSDLAEVLRLRPLSDSGTAGVYMLLKSSTICETTEFRIDLAKIGGQEMYSAALAAMLAGKKIQVEAVTSGCTGWGTELRSIYIHN